MKVIGNASVDGDCLTAPISSRRCVYYRVDVDELTSTGADGEEVWTNVASEEMTCDFYLMDKAGARLNVEGNCRCYAAVDGFENIDDMSRFANHEASRAARAADRVASPPRRGPSGEKGLARPRHRGTSSYARLNRAAAASPRPRDRRRRPGLRALMERQGQKTTAFLDASVPRTLRAKEAVYDVDEPVAALGFCEDAARLVPLRASHVSDLKMSNEGWSADDTKCWHALVDRHPCVLLSDSPEVVDVSEGDVAKPVSTGRVAPN